MKALIVVREAAVRRRLQDALAARGYDVATRTAAADGLALCRDQDPAMVVVDDPELGRMIRALPHGESCYLAVVEPEASVPALDALLDDGVDDVLPRDLDSPAFQRRLAVGERKRRARLITDRGPGLIGIHDLDGAIRYMNPAAAHALGYEPAELRGRNFIEFLTPAVQPLFGLAMERLRTDGKAQGAMPVITKTGEQRLWWYRHSLVAGLGPSACVLGDSTDITELRHADDALQEAEQRFRYLAENIHQVVWLRDTRTNEVIYVSPPFEEIWGRPRQQLFEQPLSFLETVREEDRPTVIQTFLRNVNGEATEMEYRILRPDGTQRWIRSRSFPVRDDAGQVYRVVAISEDVTERLAAQQALRQAKEAAEEATRTKSTFVANVSHEIRNPLTVIIGMADILAATNLDEEQQQCLERIHAASESLVTLAADILDISRVEAGKLELRVRAFAVREMVQRTLETFAVKAGEKGIALRCEVMPEVPEELIGDPDRLRQMLVNLVGNAIKFTDHGGVDVAIALAEPVTGGGGTLLCSVKDTGLGISEEDRQRVFEVFSQAHAATKRNYGGSGLGLAICAQLAQLMGGRIWVESEPGRGSTFCFTVRLALPGASPTP